MEDKDFEQDEVKEYRPKKNTKKRARFSDNYNLSPMASDMLRNSSPGGDASGMLSNDAMLSTSEIIDFSEGTDSWVNRH